MATAKADIVGVTLNDLRGTAVTRLALAAYTETEITVSLRGCAIVDAHYLHRNPALAKNTIGKLEMRRNLPTNRPTRSRYSCCARRKAE
jgi:hypothetical protein